MGTHACTHINTHPQACILKNKSKFKNISKTRLLCHPLVSDELLYTECI